LADSCRLDNPSKYSIRTPPNTLATVTGGYSGVLSSFLRLIEALFKSSTLKADDRDNHTQLRPYTDAYVSAVISAAASTPVFE